MICLQNYCQTEFYDAKTFKLLKSFPVCYQVVHGHKSHILLDQDIYNTYFDKIQTLNPWVKKNTAFL